MIFRKSLGRKGQVGFGIGDIPGIAVAVVVGMLVLAFGALVLSSVQADQLTANGNTTIEFNITGDGLQTLSNISTLIPTSGTVIGAAIIIGILLGAFAFVRTR